MAVIDSESWELVTQETRMKKGPLVKVELQPGRYVKMYEADAIAQGLISPATGPNKAPAKSRPAAKDKMRRSELDKAVRSKAEEGPEVAPQKAAEETKPAGGLAGRSGLQQTPAGSSLAETDDFKAIDGVGLATARALAAHGIETFEELHDAGQLDFLNAPLNAVIEKWRDGLEETPAR